MKRSHPEPSSEARYSRPRQLRVGAASQPEALAATSDLAAVWDSTLGAWVQLSRPTYPLRASQSTARRPEFAASTLPAPANAYAKPPPASYEAYPSGHTVMMPAQAFGYGHYPPTGGGLHVYSTYPSDPAYRLAYHPAQARPTSYAVQPSAPLPPPPPLCWCDGDHRPQTHYQNYVPSPNAVSTPRSYPTSTPLLQSQQTSSFPPSHARRTRDHASEEPPLPSSSPIQKMYANSENSASVRSSHSEGVETNVEVGAPASPGRGARIVEELGEGAEREVNMYRTQSDPQVPMGLRPGEATVWWWEQMVTGGSSEPVERMPPNLNYFTFIEDTKTLKYLHIDPDVACDLPRGFLYDDDSTAEVRRFLVAGSPGQKPTPVLDQRPGGRTAMRALCRTVLADGPATFPVKSYAIDAFDNTMDELKTEGIESGHLGALLAVFFHFEGERDVLLRKIHEKNFVWFNWLVAVARVALASDLLATQQNIAAVEVEMDRRQTSLEAELKVLTLKRISATALASALAKAPQPVDHAKELELNNKISQNVASRNVLEEKVGGLLRRLRARYAVLGPG